MTHIHRGLVAALAISLAAVADAQIADVRQGTNLAVAYDPASQTIVVDLLGGLWRLPVSGGGAIALIPAGTGIAQPRFDPAGRRVVFQYWNQGQWDLGLLDLTDGTWAALTETPHDEREPEFSADGRRVLFASNRTGRYSIWSLDIGDGALRQLTDDPGDAHFPTLDGAGDLIYVQHVTRSSALLRYTGGPRGAELLREPTSLDAPSWRPGGRVIVFHERVPGRRSTLKLLIDAEEPVLVPLSDAEDVFSGRVAWLSEAEYLYAADGQLWRRTIASQERRPVHLFASVAVDLAEPIPVRVPLDDPGPHVAHGIVGATARADGSAIAFAALGDIWLQRRRELARLTDDAYLDLSPRFAAGSVLVFASDRGGKMDLWTIEPDSGHLSALTDEKGAVLAPVVSADGTSVAFLTTAASVSSSPATLKRVRLDTPGHEETLAASLFDASDLRWDGDALKLSARRGSAAAELDEVVLTPDPAEPDKPNDVDGAVPTVLGPSWTPAAPDAPYVVQAGRLFDGIGNEYARHMDIHIEGQRITAIVRRDRLPLPDQVVDARERTVVPGFIDVHVHHAGAGSRLGAQWLRHGVTTVREVDAPLLPAIERAEAWASGRRPGPRLVIVPTQMVPDFAAREPVVIQTDQAISQGFAHAAASRRARAGLDAEWPRGWPILATAEIELSPLSLSYQDTIGRLLASGRFVATGLAAALVIEHENAAATGQALGATLGRLTRSSARIAIASDAPVVAYGSGYHDELAALAEAGVPPAQILRWASAGGAMALGLDQQLGTLEPGKLADFLVIDGDPLTRIEEAARIELTVVGGVRYAPAALE